MFFFLRRARDINPTHYILQFCVNILKTGLESLVVATVDPPLDEQRDDWPVLLKQSWRAVERNYNDDETNLRNVLVSLFQ